MPIPGSAIAVPCSLFSGLNTELSPSDLPEGVSPDNLNVCFLPGSVATRPGMHKLFGSLQFGGNGVQWFESFVQPNEDPLTMILDSAGTLWQEDVNNSPGALTQVRANLSSSLIGKAVTAFGRIYMAFSDGRHGIEAPWQYDGTYLDRVTQDGVGAAPTAADSATAGSISAGVHQLAVAFVTRQGYVTKFSPVGSWTAAGSKKVALSGVPTGPPNVVARIVAFTPSGGGNFFYIPQGFTLNGLAVGTTVIPDNTEQTITLDFSDNALMAATAIDVPGNNLFAQQVLGPCAGFYSYASRLMAWGFRNKVTNFLNLGFEGGSLDGVNPCGWTTSGNVGGSLQNNANSNWPAVGYAWQIAGDGTGSQKGLITQSAYQDYLGVPILLPNTKYSVRFWLKTAATTGQIIFDIYSSGGGGQLAAATVTLATKPSYATGAWVEVDFSSATPAASIPSDMVLRLYATNLPNGSQAWVDEVEFFPTLDPFVENEALFSYVDEPEQMDDVTGFLGPADDPRSLMDFKNIRDTLYFKSTASLHATQDNGSTEPSGWTVRRMADDCGDFSVNSTSLGEDWMVWAGPTGLRIFDGQFPLKVSQEVQTLWDNINDAEESLISVVNDPVTRRVYANVPTALNVANSAVYVLDYRELDTAYDIGKGTTIHISFTGRMIASDLARKWTQWKFGSGNAASYAAVLTRPGNVKQLCFAPANALGNVYYLDPAKYTDDDYGQISSYYTTYFFINHDAEMQLGVGSHRKLYTYLTAFVSGVGQLTVTPYGASLANGWPTSPPITLSQNPTHDLEWPINVTAERCAFKFSVSPLQGQTDAYFNLQKIVVSIREDPWMPIRGVI